jgi:hypothetical protein
MNQPDISFTSADHDRHHGKVTKWDRWVFILVPLAIAKATDFWLSHHSSLGTIYSLLIGGLVGASFVLPCSLALERLHKKRNR